MLIARRNAALFGGDAGPYDRAVAYLQSDGSQHIKTGLYIKDVRKFDIRAQLTETPSSTVYVCGGLRSRVRINVGCNGTNFFFVFGSANIDHSAYINADTAVHDFLFDSGKCYIDSHLRKTLTWSVQDLAVNFCLFASGSGTGNSVAYPMTGRIYSCQIYDTNNMLVRDFTPVVDFNDVACMYDRVTGTFFYTPVGAFIAGPEV